MVVLRTAVPLCDMDRFHLAELLVHSGAASAQRVDDALETVRSSPSPLRLVSVLLDTGGVREAEVAQLFARHLVLPWVALASLEVPKVVRSLLPGDTARRFTMFPVYVRREGRGPPTLFVAIEDPTWEEALATASIVAGLPVRAVIATRTQIRAAIAQSYPLPSSPSAPQPSDSMPEVTLRRSSVPDRRLSQAPASPA
jgi:hypothetical protein